LLREVSCLTSYARSLNSKRHLFKVFCSRCRSNNYRPTSGLAGALQQGVVTRLNDRLLTAAYRTGIDHLIMEDLWTVSWEQKPIQGENKGGVARYMHSAPSPVHRVLSPLLPAEKASLSVAVFRSDSGSFGRQKYVFWRTHAPLDRQISQRRSTQRTSGPLRKPLTPAPELLRACHQGDSCQLERLHRRHPKAAAFLPIALSDFALAASARRRIKIDPSE
jgi:hypothetical protein